MRATIEHLQERPYTVRGLFRTKSEPITGNWVKLSITLSPDEQSILDARNLWNEILFRYTANNQRNLVTVQEMCDPGGFWRGFGTLAEAKQWAAFQSRDHIQALKELITASKSEAQTQTFDL